jgi:putative tryptophan/tyrosine transport system substrate-binding protein
MRRRDFIKVIAGSVTAWPLAARAERPDGMRLLAVLMGYAENDPAVQSEIATFRDALAKLGWTEGRNLRIKIRWGAGDADKVRTFAKELVGLRPDAILSQTTAVTDALARETKTIPIVFVTVGDPLAGGFTMSLPRPSGNITGFTALEPTLGGKWVELLREIAPRTVRVALLSNQATGGPLQFFMPSIQAAASSLAIQVSIAPVNAKDEIESAIATQARNPGSGLIVMPSSFNVINRDLIIALAARYGLPAIYFNRLFVKSGGLINYSPDYAEQFRQAPEYIDRILKGAKPADLPVQQPTKYELSINLKAAKALGLDVPLHLQQIADEIIE